MNFLQPSSLIPQPCDTRARPDESRNVFPRQRSPRGSQRRPLRAAGGDQSLVPRRLEERAARAYRIRAPLRAHALLRIGAHWQQRALPIHPEEHVLEEVRESGDRKSTRLNSSHVSISYAVFCLKKKKKKKNK